MVFGISSPCTEHQSQAASPTSSFPISKPWKSSFLPDFFIFSRSCSELQEHLEGATRTQEHPVPAQTDTNKSLLFGMKTSFPPQSSISQRYLYTTFILPFCWELFLSSASRRDAPETFVRNLVLPFIWKERKEEFVWRGWRKMQKCNCWVPSGDARRKQLRCFPAGLLKSCRTPFFIKYSFLNKSVCT